MSKESPRISPPPLKRRRLSVTQSTSHIEPLQVRDGKNGRGVSVRLYFWNINGITPFLPPDTPAITNYFATASPAVKKEPRRSLKPSLRACLRQWQWPQILGLEEVKISQTDSKTQIAVRRSVNTPLEDEVDGDIAIPRYDVHFSLPRDKHNATGFGGKVHGVCMLIKKGSLDTTVKKLDWDLEGRVLVYEVPALQLVVMNIYAVNGTDYDYRDPRTGKVIGTRHTWKREFHTLLAHEVRNYETRGWHVTVAGDINVSRTRQDSFPELRLGEEHVQNRTDFEKKFIVELGMIDTFRWLHDDEKKYTYRPTNKPWGAGGDRVDMILATKNLEGKIAKADILDTEADRGPSDHVPHFLELNF